MQAIRTRYIGATNTKPARIQAKCEAKTIYLPYDDCYTVDMNHSLACMKLCAAMDWSVGITSGVFAGDYYWILKPHWQEADPDEFDGN